MQFYKNRSNLHNSCIISKPTLSVEPDTLTNCDISKYGHNFQIYTKSIYLDLNEVKVIKKPYLEKTFNNNLT